MFTRRSMNSYMRALRSVTLAPIGMFSRTLNCEIALRAFVITTTAKTDDEARALLRHFNFPFRQ